MALSTAGHSTAHWRRLLPESRLTPADEPPAEEAHEASNYHNDGDGDPRDGPRGEVGITIASSAIFHKVAENSTTIARWSRAARSP